MSILQSDVLELSDLGDVVKNYSLIKPPRENFAVVSKDVIMRNFFEEFVEVKIMTFDENSTSEPKVTSVGDLICIVFDQADKNMPMTLAGDFFCWIVDGSLRTLNIKDGA